MAFIALCLEIHPTRQTFKIINSLTEGSTLGQRAKLEKRKQHLCCSDTEVPVPFIPELLLHLRYTVGLFQFKLKLFKLEQNQMHSHTRHTAMWPVTTIVDSTDTEQVHHLGKLYRQCCFIVFCLHSSYYLYFIVRFLKKQVKFKIFN